MVELVVNADDLGLHPAIDEGILRAHREGILTSASVLVMGRNAEIAVKQAQKQGLALGIHLCLSTRLPSAAQNVPTVAPGGRMRENWAAFALAWMTGRVRKEEVRREWLAQVERAERLGFRPDHLDSHQHLHLLPGLGQVVRSLSETTGLPVRWASESFSPRRMAAPAAQLKASVLVALARIPGRKPRLSLSSVGIFESGRLDESALMNVLSRLPSGRHEILCHPGAADGVSVEEEPGWHYPWTTELSALCSLRVRDRVKRDGIRLSTYADLFSPAPSKAGLRDSGGLFNHGTDGLKDCR